MSENFMLLAKSELKNSGILQRGSIRYSTGIFCLGHALELTYKLLLSKEEINYPKVHKLTRLFGYMTKKDRNAIRKIVKYEGWESCDKFHYFMAKDIRLTDRKYYDFRSSYDHWTHDAKCEKSGPSMNHMYWPQIVKLCEILHQYAASTIWIDPTLRSDL